MELLTEGGKEKNQWRGPKVAKIAAVDKDVGQM